MSPTGIGFAGLVYHSGRDLLHAKNGLVELDLFVIVFRMGGNVPDLGEHLNSPSAIRWLGYSSRSGHELCQSATGRSKDTERATRLTRLGHLARLRACE